MKRINLVIRVAASLAVVAMGGFALASNAYVFYLLDRFDVSQWSSPLTNSLYNVIIVVLAVITIAGIWISAISADEIPQ